ncbi:MAG: hypothetical protein KDN05_22865, partial [Verrucomicrobiae bacterium]|nr:hypothetical protein [Verrucomicrobiae bacterium]
GTETIKGARVRIPDDARMFLERSNLETWVFRDKLATDWKGVAGGADLGTKGLALPDMPPCSALLLEIGE